MDHDIIVVADNYTSNEGHERILCVRGSHLVYANRDHLFEELLTSQQKSARKSSKREIYRMSHF